MTWGKFFVKTFGIAVFLWAVLFFAYGNFALYDSIVPYTGIEIDTWINNYYMTGLYSIIAGFLCAAFWYAVGNSYDGRSSVEVKYWLFAALSLLLSGLIYFIFLLDAMEGSGAAAFFIVIASPLLYLLSSACASPDTVKFIPPIHF